jgi:hypothetical protein
MPSQGMYVNVVKSGSVPKGQTESNSTGLRFVACLRGLYEFEYNNSRKNPVDPATWFQVVFGRLFFIQVMPRFSSARTIFEMHLTRLGCQNHVSSNTKWLAAIFIPLTVVVPQYSVGRNTSATPRPRNFQAVRKEPS